MLYDDMTSFSSCLTPRVLHIIYRSRLSWLYVLFGRPGGAADREYNPDYTKELGDDLLGATSHPTL
jgi:hypothetical protein